MHFGRCPPKRLCCSIMVHTRMSWAIPMWFRWCEDVNPTFTPRNLQQICLTCQSGTPEPPIPRPTPQETWLEPHDRCFQSPWPTSEVRQFAAKVMMTSDVRIATWHPLGWRSLWGNSEIPGSGHHLDHLIVALMSQIPIGWLINN